MLHRKLSRFLNDDLGVHYDVIQCTVQGGPKNGYPVLFFFDNFGNSTPILTILSLLQAEIYGA